MNDMASPQASIPNVEQATTNTKRKRDENGQPAQRSKRNRYISIACNECKRRKIKCNGETPCQRCGNLNLECLYAPNCCSHNFRDSNEFKQMDAQIRFLQEQVNSLMHNISSLRQALGQNEYDPSMFSFAREEPTSSMTAPQASMVVDPALQRTERPSTQQSRYQGPTSSAFSLDVAKNSLEHMGITAGGDAIDDSLVNHGQTGNSTDRSVINTSKDPIWCLNKEEALRLCSVYEDEIGLMYPILDINFVSKHANLLFTFVDAVQRNMSVREHDGPDAIDDEDTDILKIVLAIALVTEGTGQNDLATRLFTNVSKSAERRVLGNVSVKDVQILALLATYHFHSDEENFAWRVIGVAARLCIELGLHRAETYERRFPDADEREQAVKTFWSVYVLDRRWSLGTGMSFAIQESDIDRALPRPSDENAYFNAMIKYSHIATKVWKAVLGTGSDSSEPSKTLPSQEDASYLDYQVVQWKEEIPDSLRFIHPNSPEYSQYPSDPNEADGRGIYRLRVLLHLRANQMRIMIYRPFLHSATAILKKGSTRFADISIEVAKDNIRVLRHVNQSTNIYRTQQMCFNYFLLSAMAVLFLAVLHAPTKYADSCREEWYMAVDLVRGLSATSYVTRRLWRTIQGLKEVGLKVGLAKDSISTGFLFSSKAAQSPSSQPKSQQAAGVSAPPTQDAQHSAAMAMAGLAGHRVDESLFFSPNSSQQHSSQMLSSIGANMSNGGGSPEQNRTSPNRMANELSGFFEAAGDWPNSNDTGVSTNSANLFASAVGNSVAGGAMGGIPSASPETPAAGGPPPGTGSGDLFDGNGNLNDSSFAVGMAWGYEDDIAKVMRECF